MTLVQTELKATNIWKPESDYSAMQGPCSEGFHVPLSSEVSVMINIMNSLGFSTGDDFSVKLKMPYAGYRQYSNATTFQVNGQAYFWTSSFTNYGMATGFALANSGAILDNYPGHGYNIRPFKDMPVVPDNSWTTIHQGTGGVGIFHNSTLGLISLSSDGENWITIADKNLGATQVWNNGDGLTNANCGNYYQRGNNYGFAGPAGPNPTTSSTTVNARNYLPGNYYNSSTFITVGERSSVRNKNLRGGETGIVEQLVQKEIKRITIRPNGQEKQIRPVVQPKTFTVTFTETSSPSSFNPVYSDDAAGLTAGSTAFDEFFGYSAVRLNTSGVETAEITQAQSGGNGKLDITQLGTLTSGDNVMIKFPVRGIKMSKSGSTVTLSITDAIGKESDGYQYYAFQKTGDIEANASATVATSPLYLGTYLSYTDGSTLKSWSGKTPQGNYTMGNAITYAGNNGTGYTITGFYQRELINAYYMMKYGNPDCQSVIGRGFVDGNSAATATGGTNSQTNATYGESTGKYSVKLFGLEDWRGNQNQWIGGIFADASKVMWTALHDFTASISTSESQYKNTGVTIAGNGDISAVAGTNKGMFCQTAIVSNSNYDTYWCDLGFVGASRLAIAGGNWNNGSATGAFRIDVGRSASSADMFLGARLMFL